jgi:hypothetical protein
MAPGNSLFSVEADAGAGAASPDPVRTPNLQLVDLVVASPAMQRLPPEHREQIGAHAVDVVARRERADDRVQQGIATLWAGISLPLIIGVIYLQWRIDLWLSGTGWSWRTVVLPLLVGLFFVLVVAPIMAASAAIEKFLPEEDRTGTDAELIIVFACMLSIAIILGGGWVLRETSPSGLTGVLVFAVCAWLTVAFLNLAGRALTGLVTGGRVRFGLDPRDRLYADLLGLLVVAEEVMSPDEARELSSKQSSRTRALASEQAFGWRTSRRARRAYGGMFELAARSVENSFHSIVPLRQPAARTEVRSTGQRIAATLRAHGTRLVVDRSAFEADISDRLVAGLLAALRDDWRFLAVTEPPAAATRLLRRYGLRWTLAAILVAAGIVVPEVVGSVDDVLPGFRALAISAGILLAIDSPSGAVRWFADTVKTR